MVSLTALATPARADGTLPMMVVLAGAITRPMPAPMTATKRASGPYGVSTPTDDSTNRPTASNNRPAVMTTLDPSRLASAVDIGAVAAIAPANGNARTPAANGL